MEDIVRDLIYSSGSEGFDAFFVGRNEYLVTICV
jgi:hypothetical protein